jgi:hypothetical protein
MASCKRLHLDLSRDMQQSVIITRFSLHYYLNSHSARRVEKKPSGAKSLRGKHREQRQEGQHLGDKESRLRVLQMCSCMSKGS